MKWTIEAAKTAVQGFIDDTPTSDIEVKDWTKTMDLENLSDKKCRIIEAAHLYLELEGIESTLSANPSDEDYQKMLRCMHAFMTVGRDAVEGSLEGLKVQFQGPRMHAIFYKPYGDQAGMCERAVAALCRLRTLVNGQLWEEFGDDYPNMTLYAGLDCGKALVTSVGLGQDRAVLFIGDTANRPAKTLATDTRKALVLASGALDVLKEGKLKGFINEAEATVNVTNGKKVLEALGYEEDPDDLSGTLSKCLEVYPLDRIGISKLTTEVDWERLGITNNKKVDASSIFADLSGFTAFVESRMDDEDSLKEAVQILHVIRREFVRVAGAYGYRRVAYQGDRLQAVRRNDLLPESDAAEAAFALRSSLLEVVHDLLPGSKELNVSIGVKRGEIVLSIAGKKGYRDRVCLGKPARAAAQLEERLGKGELAVGSNIHAQLPEAARYFFTYNETHKAYVNSKGSVAAFQTLLVDEKTHSFKQDTKRESAGLIVVAEKGGIPVVNQNNSWSRD